MIFSRRSGRPTRFTRRWKWAGSGGRTCFGEKFHTANGKGKFLPLTIETATCNQEKQPVLASENYIQLKIKNKLVL